MEKIHECLSEDELRDVRYYVVNRYDFDQKKESDQPAFQTRQYQHSINLLLHRIDDAAISQEPCKGDFCTMYLLDKNATKYPRKNYRMLKCIENTTRKMSAE